jgi:hypothetical protein
VTPQSSFLVLATVRDGHAGPLRNVLARMNRAPGRVDPDNPLVPFDRIEGLHVARLVVLEDETLGELEVYGVRFRPPTYLAFLGDCDGPADATLAAFAREAGDGLRQVFSHCEDFTGNEDLGAWMNQRLQGSAAQYVNWLGRTVLQVKEEARLHTALRDELKARPPGGETEAQLRERLLQTARQVELTPQPATPLGWAIANAIHFVLGGLLILAAAIPLLLSSPLLILLLKQHEQNDPLIATRPPTARTDAITAAEDWDVTNPFSAIGSVKPGLFRLGLVIGVLWLLDYACRHIYTRGRLARVGTIHFARWVLLDSRRRVFFASNYDGSLESYMDDFINKAGYGLNLVFSNGVGYPPTRFLLNGGAKREQLFKNFLKRHEAPTDVWFKAYPGLTTFDLARNARIRQGVDQRRMSDAEIRAWLALI